MKKLISYVVVLFVIAMAVACSGKKEETTETEAAATEEVSNDEWPKMDEFHMVMAESFHPFKDSANLEPAKANAAEMARVAEEWASAALPEKVNNEETKANLEKLKTETAAFVTTVQGTDAAAIGTSLTNLHDLFHKLQEAWYGAGEGHKHEHKEGESH
jgi:PBP1b-binding outer membrane lipoprotein LpoB